jgi:hypothetical protein
MKQENLKAVGGIWYFEHFFNGSYIVGMMKENENGNKTESPGLLAALDRVRLLAEEQGPGGDYTR